MARIQTGRSCTNQKQSLLGRGTALQPGKAPGPQTKPPCASVSGGREQNESRPRGPEGTGRGEPALSPCVPTRSLPMPCNQDAEQDEARSAQRAAASDHRGPWRAQSRSGKAARLRPRPAPGREVAPSARGVGRPWWRGVRRRVQCGTRVYKRAASVCRRRSWSTGCPAAGLPLSRSQKIPHLCIPVALQPPSWSPWSQRQLQGMGCPEEVATSASGKPWVPSMFCQRLFQVAWSHLSPHASQQVLAGWQELLGAPFPNAVPQNGGTETRTRQGKLSKSISYPERLTQF